MNDGDFGGYAIEICGLTGLECIACRVDCPHVSIERRKSPWHGDPRVDESDVAKVPGPDLTGRDRGEAAGMQMDWIERVVGR